MIPILRPTLQWRSLLTHVPRATPRLARPTPTRSMHLTPSLRQKPMPPRPKPPPESEIEESYLKGSGPGGQKINKTNSAVQLKHLPTGIVVKSQATRSRSQNRKIARESLAQKVDDFYRGDQSRSAVVGDIKKKRSDSAAKKRRRKYKKLDSDRSSAAERDDGETEEDDYAEEGVEGEEAGSRESGVVEEGQTALGGTVKPPDGHSSSATTSQDSSNSKNNKDPPS